MVQIIDEYREPTFGERFAQGIARGAGEAARGIPQAYGSRLNRQAEDKRLKELTGQDFSSLHTPELRNKMASELMKGKGQSSFDDTYKQVLSFAKNFNLDLDPETSLSLTQKSGELMQKGVPASMAITMAIQEFMKGTKEPAVGMELGKGLKEFAQELPRGALAGFASPVTNIESATQVPGSIAKRLLGDKAGVLVETLAGSIIPGYQKPIMGAKETVNKTLDLDKRPSTPLGRAGRNVGELAAMIALDPEGALTKGIIYALPAGLIGQAAEEMGFGTVGKMIGELTALGAPSIMNLMKNRSTQNIAQNTLRKVSEAGIELPAEGLGRLVEEEALMRGLSKEELERATPKARKEVDKILKQFSKSEPSILNERISRLYTEEARAADQARRAQVLDEQLRYAKSTKIIREDILGEESRLAEKAAKESRKGAEVTGRERQLQLAAEKEIPAAKRELEEADKFLSEIKDELSLAKKTNASKEKIDELVNQVERAEARANIAKEQVRSHEYQAKSGKPYETQRDLRTKAENKAETIAEDLLNKSIDDVVKENELSKLAQEWKNRKTIPGQEMLPEDTFTRIRKEAIRAYKNKLEEVKRMLHYAHGEQEAQLLKQKEAFERLIKKNKDERFVQRRRQGLQDMSKTLLREQKLKGKQLTSPEIENILKDRFGITEEKVQETFKEASKEAEKILQEVKSSVKVPVPITKGKMEQASDIIKKNIKRGTVKKGVVDAISKLTGISPGWIYVGGTATGAFGVFNYSKWKNEFVNWTLHQQSKDLTPQQKILFVKKLKDEGYSSQRIKKILKTS